MEFKDTNRIGPFWQSLKNKGYKIEDGSLNAMPVLRLTSPNGKHWLTSTNISYPMVSELVVKIATDKALAYAFADRMNVSIPETREVRSDDRSAAEDLLKLQKKVIVKPIDSFGSQGVTLNITEIEQLQAALDVAFVYSSTVLVQQQVPGDELRFTIIDGEVASVLLRQTPRVIGDGHSTIAELIRIENEKRSKISLQYVNYPILDEKIINKTYLTDTTVIGNQETFELSQATMVKNGAKVYEVYDDTHKDYAHIAKKLATEMAAGFIVVDMFIIDYRKPAEIGTYWFNEFNTSPALKMYYAPVNKDVSQIADAIVNRFDKMISNGL